MERKCTKPRVNGAIVLVLLYIFSGCGGPQPTMSQLCFVSWSQVQETKNWGDPSSATFSCLTFYTASKMTRWKSLLGQVWYLPAFCASSKKMDLCFPLRWATSRGHPTGSGNAIPIAVRENRFVPSRHSSDQMCWLMADWVIDFSNIPAYGLP